MTKEAMFCRGISKITENGEELLFSNGKSVSVADVEDWIIPEFESEGEGYTFRQYLSERAKDIAAFISIYGHGAYARNAYEDELAVMVVRM